MKVVQADIEKIIPYASNSRTHSEEQVAQIAASIKEPWAFCIENDCYAVGESGNVYRVCRRQTSRSGNLVEHYGTVMLKGSVDKDGYKTYRMMVDGVKRHVKGHRLVMNAFRGRRPDMCVNHKDGNKHNNHLQNLEWVTVAENNAHAIETGLIDPYKPNIKNTKIMWWDYTAIHAMHKLAGISRADIAKMNGVCRQTIDKIINRVDGIMGEANAV